MNRYPFVGLDLALLLRVTIRVLKVLGRVAARLGGREREHGGRPQEYGHRMRKDEFAERDLATDVGKCSCTSSPASR